MAKSAEEVAHGLKEAVHRLAFTGPHEPIEMCDAMPPLSWPLSMLIETIERDRRKQVQAVLPFVKAHLAVTNQEASYEQLADGLILWRDDIAKAARWLKEHEDDAG